MVVNTEGIYYFIVLYVTQMGRISSVGIATCYGLDDPGIESRWGRDFPHPSRPALGPTQPPLEWVPSLSRGKVTGEWRNHPHPSRAVVKERVELYFYSPFGPVPRPVLTSVTVDVCPHTLCTALRSQYFRPTNLLESETGC